jgi:preflagellin peptidase FlaK
MLDVLRFAVGMAILLYASYTDFKYREARNELWIVMGAIGVVLLLFSDYPPPAVLFSVMLTLPIAFVVILAGMGGADAKALIAISLLAPLFPHIDTALGELPLWIAPVEFPFPVIVFINSLLLFLVIPIAFFVRNVLHGDLVFPYCFFGCRMRASDIPGSHVWPMEKIEEGQHRKSILPQRDVDPAVFGDEIIWATPKVPFLIPLTAGYAISFLLGDIVYQAVSAFV